MSVSEDFGRTLSAADAEVASAVRDYVAWRTRGDESSFVPAADDDVAVRTYLMHLRAAGADRDGLRNVIRALGRLYDWAHSQGLIPDNPFDEYDFDRPILTRQEIRRREDAAPVDPLARELARLRGLVEVADHLNRSPDVQTLLQGTVELLLRVMDLATAWAFVSTESGLGYSMAVDTPPHDFYLAAACGLPSGLEQQDRRFLVQPPDCHCQGIFRRGRLTRAVNIVECTRLASAAAANGDTRGLLFHASVPLISQGRPLGLINVATREWQLLTAADLEFLSAVGSQVAVALERAHLYDEAEARRQRFERELAVAHQVQASLLPRELPVLPGFSLAADWRSAREVAGDFYDVFPLHDGRWGLVIGDVADKGAPAALYMAMARALIRSSAPRHHGPANALIDVNARLAAETTYDMFITLFYGILDPATRTLSYANAGHNPPLLRRASGALEELARTGHILGAFPTLRLQQAEIALGPGDALVAYTDGVTDALNARGEAYGQARLRAAVGAGPAQAAGLLQHLDADLAGFVGSTPQPDDITLFVVTTGTEEGRDG